MRSRTLARACACVALLAGSASAQSAARGALILALPTSPRTLGMSDVSGVAFADAWALFSAPASLGAVHASGIALASEAYLVSTRLSAGAVVVPALGGTLGIGATLLDYGTIDEVASTVPGADGTETGRTWGARDQAIVLGFGRTVRGTRGDGVRLGGSVEIVSSRVAELTANGVAASAGVAWSPRVGWDVGGSVQHVGQAITLGATRGELPLTLRLAAAAPAWHARGFAVRPMLEARTIRGGGNALAGAAEAEWRAPSGASVALRAGYTLRVATDDDRWPVALGAGVGFGAWVLDYAVQRFETIDQFTHRVGVRYVRHARRVDATAVRPPR